MKKIYQHFSGVSLLTILVVQASFAQPVITAVTPAKAAVGTSVIITGTNFSPVAANDIVYFGAVKVTPTLASATSLTVTVPFGATYDFITVTTGNRTAYSPSPFNVLVPGAAAAITFAAPFDVTASLPFGPFFAAVGDMDRDGKPDLVISQYSTNQLSIYLNTTTTHTISLTPALTLTMNLTPAQAAVGDLDGDGWLDIAAADETGQVYVFRNTSTGGAPQFATPVILTAGTNPYGIVITDLDGDGRPDLVVANEQSNNLADYEPALQRIHIDQRTVFCRDHRHRRNRTDH